MPNRSQRGLGDDVKPSVDAALGITPPRPSRARRRHPDRSRDLWSPYDVADYLELSPNTVYAMLARGEVPGQIRFGRHWKISVRAFMRAVHGEAAQAS